MRNTEFVNVFMSKKTIETGNNRTKPYFTLKIWIYLPT